LDRGDLCVAALEGERLIAYVWRAFGSTPAEDGLWITVPKPARYGSRGPSTGVATSSRCSPSRRAGSVSNGAKPQGLSYVETHHYPFLRSNLRHGTRYLGYFNWFGRRLTFRTADARRLGVRAFLPTARGS
jgi:hypothetical protein